MDDTTCKICLAICCIVHIGLFLFAAYIYQRTVIVYIADVLICCVVKEFEYSHYS